MNLPIGLKKLTYLNSLGLTENQTESFSDFGSDLPNLKEIIINSNHSSNYSLKTVHKPFKKFDTLRPSVRECLNELLNKGCRILKG